MAINKKLVHFNEKSKFNEQNNAGNILDTSIVFIKDSNEIFTHKTPYSFIGWSELMIDIPEGYRAIRDSNGIYLRDSSGEYLTVIE